MTRAVYLDSNIFITAFETSGSASEWAWAILDAVTEGGLRAQTSELTLAELLPKPLRLGSELLIEIYTGLIQTGGLLSVTAVTRPILIRSAGIRAADRATRLPDAIHIATALETDCIAIVSDDQRIRTPASLPLIRLAPESLELIRRLDL